MAGICGIYCGTCPWYLAYRKHDLEQLNKLSETNNIPIEQIRCDGCLSTRTAPDCAKCGHGFRKCAAENNVKWCFQCPQFPCDRLQRYRDVHVVDGVSHHIHVIDNLLYMKKHGVSRWVQEQEKTACCPNCGNQLYWFTHECLICHAQIH